MKQETNSQWVRDHAVFQQLQRFSSHRSVFVAHFITTQVTMRLEHRRTFHTENTITTSIKMH
jgi:hypothetical protein